MIKESKHRMNNHDHYKQIVLLFTEHFQNKYDIYY